MGDRCIKFRGMKTLRRMTAALLAATVVSAPAIPTAAAAEDETDWTGGRPLPEGTEVPYEPGYGSSWKSYDAIKLGNPDYRNSDVRGIRVVGNYKPDTIMCVMNFKGGVSECYADGKQAVELGWGAGGKIVTTDPVVAMFAPVVRSFVSLERQLSSSRG